MPENIGSFFLPVFAQHFMQKSAMTSKTDLPLRSDIIDKGVEECKRRLERSYPAEILSAFPCHSGADRHLTVPVQNCL